MSADVPDPHDATDDAPVPDRYAAVETGDGDLVVFDAKRSSAWIQSTTASSLEDRR